MLAALERAGFAEETNVVYTSDAVNITDEVISALNAELLSDGSDN